MAKRNNRRRQEEETVADPNLPSYERYNHVDKVQDEDDDDITDDEAFNSDDERKYGDLFSSKKTKQKKSANDDDDDSDDGSSSDSDSDSDSEGIAGSDNEEEGDGGDYMLSLLENLDKTKPTTTPVSHTQLPESEFTSVSSQTTTTGKLTLNELMGGISDTKGFTDLQHTVASTLTSHTPHNDPDPSTDPSTTKLSTTAAPASRIVSERAKRKVNYEHQSSDLKNWNSAVSQNRNAETLDFRPKLNKELQLSQAALVGKFTPESEFEKEVAAALEEEEVRLEALETNNGQILEEHSDDGEDDLGHAATTEQHMRKRRGELAKIRALLFYEEQKRHHMNKIKSKKYRKIRKKQRDKLSDKTDAALTSTNDEYAEQQRQEDEEEAEMERMKERMSLAHKNTSKWAKRQLRRGKNVDVDTRRALSAQLATGDEIRNKMKTIRGDDSESDEDESDARLVEKARALLSDAEGKKESKQEGLLAMNFMQKGLERQREQAKEEARQLLEELEANDEFNDEHGSEDEATEQQPPSKKKKKKKKQKQAVPDDSQVAKGKLVAKGLEFGHGNSVTVAGGISVDLQLTTKAEPTEMDSTNAEKAETAESTETTKSKGKTTNKQKKKKQAKKADVPTANNTSKNAMAHTDHSTTLVVPTNTASDTTISSSTADTQSTNVNAMAMQQHTPTNDNEENPWISQAQSSRSKKRTAAGTAVNLAELPVPNARDTSAKADATEASKPNQITGARQTVDLSQEELVKRAFAAPSMTDVEADFEKEKDDIRAKDDPLHPKSKKQQNEQHHVAGWGSWSGMGAPPPKPKRLPKHLLPKQPSKPKKRRADDALQKVIINEKRMKKNLKFQIDAVPYPYRSRAEYEHAMAGPIGKEWNVTSAVKNMTRAEILTKAGSIIKPLSQQHKQKQRTGGRAPAKF